MADFSWLCEDIETLMTYITDGYTKAVLNQAVNAIRKLSADVAPVRHGRWTQHYVGQENIPWGSDCSVCGEWLVIDRTVMNEKYHYCPNCGASMTNGGKT